MSKKLVIFISLLILFSGISWATDDLWLEIGHRLNSWNAEAKEQRFFVNSGSNWIEEYIINSSIQTSSVQKYLTVHYSPFSGIVASITTSLTKTKLSFNDIEVVNEINYTWNDLPYSQSGNRPTDSFVGAQGKMDFFYGAGIEIIPYQNENFNVSLQVNYSQQTVSEKFRIYDFASSIRLDPYDPEIWHWGQYIEIEKAKIKQTELKLNISGSSGKFNFSAGPMILIAEMNFTGSTDTIYGFESHFDPEMRPKIRKQNEFQFSVKNKNLFAGFARIGYEINKHTELFLEKSFGALDTTTAGIKIKL